MNKKMILAVTLFVVAFILVGCMGQQYNPTPSQPKNTVTRDMELANSILSKIEQNSNTLTDEEMNFTKNLISKIDTDATFTSKEVKILLMYFGVLSPQKLLPDRTSFNAPLPNVDNAVISIEDNSIQVAFRNNKGVAVSLPLTGTVAPQSGNTCSNPVISGTYNNLPIVAGVTLIPNGGGFILKWDCDDLNPMLIPGDAFKATMTFQYTNVETGQLLTHTGEVSGKYISTESPTTYIPKTCLASTGFGCLNAPVIKTDSIAFTIENGMGYTIDLETSKMSLDNIPCPGSANVVICAAPDTNCSSSDFKLEDGGEATIVLKGCNIPTKGVGGNVRFSYTSNSGLTEVLVVRISGKP